MIDNLDFRTIKIRRPSTFRPIVRNLNLARSRERNHQRTVYNSSVSLRGRGSYPGGGVLPYMGYIGMCGPKGYGFSAVFVINIDFSHLAAILVIKRVAIFAL